MEFDLALTVWNTQNPSTLGVDDKFAVVISTDGGATWWASNTLRLWDSTTPISHTGERISIDLSGYSGIVKLGFYGESTVSNADNDLFVDNVWVGNPSSPPGCTVPVSPTDGATNANAPNGNLVWSSASLATGYYLYFGTDGGGVTPPTNIVNGVDMGNTLSYAYSGLSYSTTYYWQVVPYNSYGNASGCPIWSFTTMGDPNWGSGGGYYFANSLATNAPSYPTYNWIDISATGTYVDVTSTNSGSDGTDGVLADDDWVGPYDFGFTFPFMGRNYTQFCICSNGKIYFGNLGSTQETIYTGAMGTGATIRPAVYWMGRDMNPQDPDVPDRAVIYGPANGGMVITFWHYPRYNGQTDPNDYFTAQVIFYPNGNIMVQYNEDELGSSFNYTTMSQVVGIVDSLGANFIEYRRLTGSTVNSPGPLFGSSLAVMFGPDPNNVPIELVSFGGVGGPGYAQLRWETATEHENLGFYLMRRPAGAETFVRVNRDLIPGAGTTLQPRTYEYRDEGLPAGIYTYTLVDVSFDGATTEHGPITLVVGDELPREYSVQARSGDQVEFRVALPVKTSMHLAIYDVAGREVWRLERDDMAPGTYAIAWPGVTAVGSRAASSTYVYRVRCGDEFVQTGKVVLLR